MDENNDKMEIDCENNIFPIQNLDKTTLNQIFMNLNAKKLILMTEISPYFNETIETSKNLMNKLRLVLKFQDTEDDKKSNKKLLDDYEKCITRKYQHLSIIFLKENIFSKSMKKQFLDSIINNLDTELMTTLDINTCYLPRHDFISLLKKFPNLSSLILKNIMFSDDIAIDSDECLALPKLRHFRLIHGDFFCLLLIKNHTKLHTLEILSPGYNRTDVEELENFLLNQRELKVLSLSTFRFNSTYSTNRLVDVPFQLDELCLRDVHWDIANNASLFLQTQKNLKHFELANFQRWIKPKEQQFLWFNNIMRHILINNSQLESVVFDEKYSFSYLKNDEFLVDECNKNIKKLKYVRCSSSEKSEVLQIFATRLVPSVQNLEIVFRTSDGPDVLRTLESFDKLTAIAISSSIPALAVFPQKLMPQLRKFQFTSLGVAKAFGTLKSLLMQNTQIEEISLNIEPLTTEEISELIMTFSSTLQSLTIQNLYLNPNETEMVINNFKNLRQIASDINPSSEVLKILTAAKIEFNLIN